MKDVVVYYIFSGNSKKVAQYVKEKSTSSFLVETNGKK